MSSRRAVAPVPGVWSATWEALLSGFGLGAMLERGRDVVREGRVVSLEASPGVVTARVKNAAPAPLEVEIAFRRFPKAVWAKAARALAARASFAASLLSGRIPQDVEAAFEGTGYRLLPQSEKDVQFSCSRDGDERLCEHAAAALVVLGDRLEHDPFLLFLLRGVTREGLLGALRKGRGGKAQARAPEVAPVPLEPLPDLAPDRFFRPLAPLASLRSPYEPSTDHGEGLLARLGPLPFADIEASRLLHDLHRAVGLGAAERLEEWEWGRAGTRR